MSTRDVIFTGSRKEKIRSLVQLARLAWHRRIAYLRPDGGRPRPEKSRAMSYDVWTHTQMDGVPAEKQAARAIAHTLTMIHDRPELGWFDRDDIAVWCGITDTAIYLVERRALRKLRNILKLYGT